MRGCVSTGLGVELLPDRWGRTYGCSGEVAAVRDPSPRSGYFGIGPPAVIPADVEGDSENIASYGFLLSGGHQLFVLWTDGEAVVDDPSVTATLTFPGVSDTTVIGIDILQGFEQELIASEEGGHLVVHNLLVKDYPIVLRLSSTRYVFLPTVLKGYPR